MQKKDRGIITISATVSIIPALGWSIASFVDPSRLCRLEQELQKKSPESGTLFRQSLSGTGQEAGNALTRDATV
jgi:hypothetical protein